MKNEEELRNPQKTSANTFLPGSGIRDIQPSRREVLRAVGVAGAATIAGAFALKSPVAMAQSPSSSPSSSTSKVNPFKDPSYAEGMRERMQQFIRGGADPEATRAIFAEMT
ncbi:MAG: twin-arginine translocation signal domain-containing protein, partial [Candidatus Acidiferrales bacterium]